MLVMKRNDISFGTGSHGELCCPHTIIGYYIGNYHTVMTSGAPVQRRNDYTVHTCPHCGFGMANEGSMSVIVGGQGVTRVGDSTTEFCGTGTNVVANTRFHAGG